jgi:hypothetical protein
VKGVLHIEIDKEFGLTSFLKLVQNNRYVVLLEDYIFIKNDIILTETNISVGFRGNY